MGANVKESGLFSGAGHLGDGGIHVLNPISPSQWRQRFFYKEGEGTRTNRSKEGIAKSSMYRAAQSILIGQVMVWCASSGFSHPGSMVEGQQISWSLKVGVCIF